MNRLLIVLLAIAATIGCGKAEAIKGDTGAVGITSEQGPSVLPEPTGALTPIIKVDPCPDFPATSPEIFFLIGSKLYGVFASGEKIHLVQLIPGNYVTTDGRNCRFAVSASGSIIR